jgi:hypothetical protein
MSTFPTKQLILEGPDLAGKTTLYRTLHDITDFKWNIQDRSSFSMLCYARLYGRNKNIEIHRKRLQDELNDLNNRMIVLLPSFDVIESRFHLRGDEFQNLKSLKKLYDIFSEEVKLIEKRPTVMCLNENNMTAIVTNILEWSHSLETCMSHAAGEVVRDTLHGVIEDELTLTVNLRYPLVYLFSSGSNDSSDDYPSYEILEHDLEGDYYTRIKKDLYKTIQSELTGDNPHRVPQGFDSRRFFYNSNTCISGLHFMPRGNQLKIIASLRSTDVDRNASCDLQFIEFLSHYVNQKFNFDCTDASLKVTFNSAHIRRDLEV